MRNGRGEKREGLAVGGGGGGRMISEGKKNEIGK